MNVHDIIVAKRDGAALTKVQIEWFMAAYSAGPDVADEQAAALAMAIYFNGLNDDELAWWTRAMIESGETLDFGSLARPTVDKHSTGGVGDKVSLILVPLVAACGAAVPQLSGRGLGHTGGTLDKMEAISGWKPDLEPDDMCKVLNTVGGFIAGASAALVPADRKLYALRDVTGTVESIPLIASSIMSKKIAEGTDSLVLDVKVGRGAFMTNVESARSLAQTMVDLGAAHGVATSALLTRMDDVLGRAVGNALEVQEALDVLAGGGPADVIEVTIALAEEMLRLAGIAGDPQGVLASGRALETFEQMVTAQGGDLRVDLPEAHHRSTIEAAQTGTIQRVDARSIGVVAWRLGAGRARKEDSVSAGAGVVCLVKPGDEVEIGQPVLELRTDERHRLDAARSQAEMAIDIGRESVDAQSVVIDRVPAA